MFEDITNIDLNILSLFVNDYAVTYSIRHITTELHINYAHAFNRIHKLIQDEILFKKKTGQVNSISLNIQNLKTIHLLSFVEEIKSRNLKNSSLELLTKEALRVDPFCCIGIFGSRVSGRATKESDWDVFIITQKQREMEKIMAKFPHVKNIQLHVISGEEFQESLLSSEETIVKHIVRNKQIIYNPHPFYSIIQQWEMIKYAPTQ